MTTHSILLAALLGCSTIASALVKDITATFRPDPAKPHENRFLNTTANEGYCSRYPGACESFKIFSLQLPIKFSSNSPIQANHGNPRQGAMFKVPGNWRSLQVINLENQQTETVEVRIAGIGALWRTSRSVSELVGIEEDRWTEAHRLLWDSASWLYPPPPCGISNSGDWGPKHYASFWLTPNKAVCAKQALFDIADFSYDYIDFAYELRTPNPLGMSSGTYSGEMHYTVGPSMDFDMGDVMFPDDNKILLNFKLYVEHVLKVEIPPGGNKVELVPEGGWQAWLQHTRKPTRLFRDQTFNLWVSSNFKMTLECGLNIGNTCGLESPDHHQVPLDILVSLPSGLTDVAGNPVNRRPLQLDGVGTEQFQPRFYLDRKPGVLHFEVQKEAVRQMLDEHPGSTYSGTATVIWDSEV
ncbi:hypothetical protein [Pseudomonas atagonensis]|uniref:hypothetical protein n=1 Tax=Pseudomonas atagonensis TaxID=2609964 RepID=UPI00140B1C5D|nr:hypothetical protein [Pseudomonas atagonensis]